jgi:hypothetical protein
MATPDWKRQGNKLRAEVPFKNQNKFMVLIM